MSYYIGLMSGTSLDAIDVALCQRTKDGFLQIAGLACDLDADLRLALLTICQEKKVDLQTLGEVEQQFSIACANAVNLVLKKSALKADQIAAIGSHGQTLFHHPDGRFPFTLQIGDGNLIAAKTEIPCVSDFRGMDIAYGGQGAPLTPAFHQALFAQKDQLRIILNIGGIANISLLQGDSSVSGYDTGPGNMLMDSWINKIHHKNFDKDAHFAKQGNILPILLSKLLNDPYFSQIPPKSTGREKFNGHWLATQLATEVYAAQDIQRTLLEFTAISICDQIRQNSECDVFVCGGGALNPLLMQRLQALLPKYNVMDTKPLKIEPMFVEAVAFAWLAEQRLKEKSIPLKAITGATQNTISGAIYLPSTQCK